MIASSSWASTSHSSQCPSYHCSRCPRDGLHTSSRSLTLLITLAFVSHARYYTRLPKVTRFPIWLNVTCLMLWLRLCLMLMVTWTCHIIVTICYASSSVSKSQSYSRAQCLVIQDVFTRNWKSIMETRSLLLWPLTSFWSLSNACQQHKYVPFVSWSNQ